MENREIVQVKNACITKLEDKYRFGYDGYRIELEPSEAQKFYWRIERALNTYSSDFLSVAIKVKTDEIDRYFNINREQLFGMFIEMRADERNGEALWCK